MTDQSVSSRCPRCKRSLRVPMPYVGRMGICPRCECEFVAEIVLCDPSEEDVADFLTYSNKSSEFKIDRTVFNIDTIEG